nr:PREDICTED: DNA (cytosine-5)-methyltransferase DRM2-like [Musa acuminata subsp. malaccensis]
MDWTNGSEGNEDFEWDSDDEATTGDVVPSSESLACPPGEGCETGPSRSAMVCHFMGMGFSEDMIMKAIKENGEENSEAILEALLTYMSIGTSPSEYDSIPRDLSVLSNKDEAHDNPYDRVASVDEELFEDFPAEDRKLLILVEMGFPTNDASAAIARCGPNASILELADSIHAAQLANKLDDNLGVSTVSSLVEDERQSNCPRGAESRFAEVTRSKRRCTSTEDEDSVISFSKPMVGFSLPNQRMYMVPRKISEAAIGPPYFYYENVALAPKGVWETMSRFLYDIKPEFVDSKYFCAAVRKRGYIHNLPIHNRFPVLPIPPRTIHEVFPATKKWWPSWDLRKQFNCLLTCISSSRLTERIRRELVQYDDPPPLQVRQFVLNECRRWNLIWVGQHKVAPLEPDELEILLGYPRNHTRGGGMSRTERYRSLGNSFQVDTVAYHLSTLKNLFPDGLKVLSLFSGIGGAEVALHRLGVHMKVVVSVEISKVNRDILRSWWQETGQSGMLIQFVDVQELNPHKMEHLVNRFGGFDLVIGGSPCNNLTGSNRYTRIGLEGIHSSLFFDYWRILDLVKCLMGRTS